MTAGKVIFIADDHNLVAEGLELIIKNHPIVKETKIFQDGEKLYFHSKKELPDIVFLDLEMPNWNGTKTLEQMKASFPKTTIYMLSMLNEKTIIEECMKRGADGYLNKDCSKHELYQAIESTVFPFFSNEVLKILTSYKTNSIRYNNAYSMSVREKEILTELCNGLTPKEIAEKLFISPRTVETHKNNIMSKFEVNSIGKLISIAIKNKIV